MTKKYSSQFYFNKMEIGDVRDRLSEFDENEIVTFCYVNNNGKIALFTGHLKDRDGEFVLVGANEFSGKVFKKFDKSLSVMHSSCSEEATNSDSCSYDRAAILPGIIDPYEEKIFSVSEEGDKIYGNSITSRNLIKYAVIALDFIF